MSVDGVVYEEFARLIGIDIKNIKENVSSIPRQDGGRIFYYQSKVSCLLFEVNLIGSLEDDSLLFIYYDGYMIYSVNGILCYRSCCDIILDELSLSPERKFSKEDEKRISIILDELLRNYNITPSNWNKDNVIITTLHRTVKHDFILSPDKKDITILIPLDQNNNNNTCNII
jgi:hypothetical protein